MSFFKSLRKGRKSSFSSEAGLQSPNGGKTSRSGRGDDDAASMMAGTTSATSSPQQGRLGQGAGRGVIGSPIQEDGPAGFDGLGPTSPTLSVGGENRAKSARGFFTRSNSKRDTLSGGLLPQRTLSYGQSAAGSSSEHGTPASPPFENPSMLSPSSNALAEATAEAANQPPGGARPSDLFAGKGLAWGEVDLSPNGTTVAKTPQQTDDLSNFLKA
jgi:hypothetical protein